VTAGTNGQLQDLRARAAKCRAFAREYASDVGASLSELAVELDLQADRLEGLQAPAVPNQPRQA
jgi:hypothetical protein